MSSTLCTLHNTMGVQSVIHFVMPATQETLAEYLRREIYERGLSYRKVADRSGGLVSHSTVSAIINGDQKKVSTEILSAIAKGMGIPAEEIFAVARGKSPKGIKIQDERFELLSLKFKSLPKSKRAKIEPLVELLERELERLTHETRFDA